MKAKEIISTVTLGAACGIAIGVTIEFIFSYIFSETITKVLYSPGVPEFLNSFTNIHTAVGIERVVYALFGIVATFAGKLYENEQRPLLLSSALHFAIVLSFGILAGAYLKWWNSGIELLGIILTIILVYLMIWLGIYLSTREEIRKINKQLS